MGVSCTRFKPGQMTVELVVGFPALLIVALIAVNAALFFSECAAFDRIAREAVRIHATAPAYGYGQDQALAAAQSELEQAFDRPYLAVDMNRQTVGMDFERYTARLRFTPTLFGMGLRTEFLGVPVPELVHETSYVVDTYRPGVFL